MLLMRMPPFPVSCYFLTDINLLDFLIQGLSKRYQVKAEALSPGKKRDLAIKHFTGTRLGACQSQLPAN